MCQLHIYHSKRRAQQQNTHCYCQSEQHNGLELFPSVFCLSHFFVVDKSTHFLLHNTPKNTKLKDSEKHRNSPCESEDSTGLFKCKRLKALETLTKKRTTTSVQEKKLKISLNIETLLKTEQVVVHRENFRKSYFHQE